MFKTRRSAPGSSPATLVPHLVDGKAVRPVIQLMSYDRNGLEEKEITDLSELQSHLKSGRNLWINVDGLGDDEALKTLGEYLDLHPLALEDVLNTGQRPKVEVYADYLFIVVQMIYQEKDRVICGEQVSMFLGRNYVITFQEEGDYDVFDPVRKRLRSGAGSMRKGKPDYLAYALLDSVIDHYYPVLEDLGNDIEELEERLLNHPAKEMVKTLHGYKRQLTQLRRIVWPMRDVVNSLLHDNSGHITSPTKVFLRDCYDHTVQLMDFVESYKEITSGLMELYHSSVGLRTNEIMRVLTVITSIFIPLTFIVGVYGMNFQEQAPEHRDYPLNMPELYHPYGYIGIWVVMILIAVVQLVFFRRKNWL